MTISSVKAGKEASAGAAQFGARAGQAIRGNLFRGGGGQFQAGPAAQLQNRLAAIRAKRLAKGKKKGKRAAKPKATPAQRAAAKQQAKDAARSKTLTGLGIDAGAQGALAALRGGKQPSAQDVARGGLVEAGLAERAKDGSYRMTQAGRSLIRAAESGDAGRAGDVISSAREKLGARKEKATTRAEKQAQAKRAKAKAAAARAKQKAAAAKPRVASAPAAPAKKPVQPAPIPAGPVHQTATKDIAMLDYDAVLASLTTHSEALADLIDDTGAVKAGARHSASDTALIQSIYDAAEDICELAEALGATVTDEDTEEPDAADMLTEGAGEATMKAIADDPIAYAYHECGDIQAAASALAQIAQLAASEASEQDDDTSVMLARLRSAMQLLTDFISNEIGEIKAIGAREDVSPADKKRAVAAYGNVTYADAKNKKYPIDTEEHIRAAWNYLGQAKNQAMYSADEVTAMKARIIAAWKKVIDKAGPPSAETKKSIERISGLHEGALLLDDEDTAFAVSGDAVKALDGGGIGGLGIRFGSSEEPDMSYMRDFFSKDTRYWLDAWKTRPMLYHHAQDKSTTDDPIIGSWTKAVITDEGVWFEGELNRAYKYHSAIKEMVRRGLLRISTDSALHLIVRERQDNGTNAVKRWPIVAASLTVSPAEPRLSGVSFKSLIEELGLPAEEDEPEIKVGDDRARRLLLELALLELEATAV